MPLLNIRNNLIKKKSERNNNDDNEQKKRLVMNLRLNAQRITRMIEAKP
jgi:hypothetical protein